MMQRMALPLGALLLLGACGRDVSGPTSDAAARAAVSGSSARSGAINVTKNCSTYTGQAGDVCTITSSNVKAIEVGSVITYLHGATADGMLSSDIVLDPPGPGNSKAFGHCTLSLVTGVGTCTLSGGTGKFRHLSATVAVRPLGDLDFAWDGTYSYGR